MGIGSGTKQSQNDPYQFRKGVSLGKKIYVLSAHLAQSIWRHRLRWKIRPPPSPGVEFGGGGEHLFYYLANVAYAEKWADGGESAYTRQTCVTPAQ